MSWQMTVSIVPRGEGERAASAAVEGGAGGGTLILGKGTAGNALLQFLGLGETAKDILLSIVDEERTPRVIEAIAKSAGGRRGYGVSFSLDVSRLWRAGSIATETEPSPENSEPPRGQTEETMEYMLVAAIVNAGYAEDAVAAARIAGATGGTVLNARGTARDDDAAFFGVKLVPEKELLLIVVDKARAKGVFDAIRALPCLSEKGSGIVFEIPAARFAALGGQR